MASDTVSRAQEIIWNNSNGRDISRVIQAISDQFNEAVVERVETRQNRSVYDLTQHN